MTERDPQDGFNEIKYAFNKLTNQERDILERFDEFCMDELNRLGLEFDPEVGAMIEKKGYSVIPGSEEAVNKWNMFIEEGKSFLKPVDN